MIAAEASSAHYALKLIQYWKSEKKDYIFFGVGSAEMELLGFERFGKSEEMAVVGIAEIISHYSDLKVIFNKLIDEALKRRPDVVILMDYPDFNLMLAKKLSEAGLKVVYYISPQVWAWRKGRIEKIKKYCQKVYLLFPFEVEFYKSKKVAYEFVGHPLLDELNEDLLNARLIDFQRERYGIRKDEKILALMPGSRKGELSKNFLTQLEVAKKLMRSHAHLRLAILIAPGVSRDLILSYLDNFKSPYLLLQDDPNKMISLADYVLVASGTATLMVGLLQKPMVIMYKLNWLTALVAKQLIKGVKYFGLVNLILENEVVPERLQDKAHVDELFNLLNRYIVDVEYCASVVDQLKQLRYKLGDKGATERVAKSIETYF